MKEVEPSQMNGTGGRLVIAALAVMFAGAAVTQAGAQVFRRDYVLSMAKQGDKGYVTRTEPARRGEIVTRDGKMVAANVNDYEVGISYKLCPKTDGFFMDVARSTGLSAADLADGPARGVSYRSWTQRLTRDQLQEIKRIQKDWKADGLTARPIDSREYPMGDQYSGVVGVVRAGQAISGLERGLNSSLSGKAGTLVGFQDRYGTFVPATEIPSTDPVNGKAVTLTIDSALQSAAFDAVKKAVIDHDATSGCAVVVDPKTGDVLAQANWPSYDPNGNLDPELTFSSSYMAALEPGSTFKILTLAKVLDEGKIDPAWHTTCTGELPIDGKHSVKCDAHHGTSGAHGDVDMVKAIAVSCNTTAAKWSLSLGREDMVQYMGRLGLVGKPGLGLPGESAGNYDRNDTSRMQTANFGFGQAMVCSPVALAGAFAMLGNHGGYIKPRLVKSLDGVDQPRANAVQVVKPSTADSVLKTMESVIQSDYGTGASLRIPGYRLAGKTGTAQKLKGSKTVGYVSNFVGFVPSVNPRACVLVMVDNPKKGYYGAVVAGPVFTEIAKAVLRRTPVEIQGPEAIPQSALLAANRSSSFEGLSAELAKGLKAGSTESVMFQQSEVPTKFNEEGGTAPAKGSVTVVKEARKIVPNGTKAQPKNLRKKIETAVKPNVRREVEDMASEVLLSTSPRKRARVPAVKKAPAPAPVAKSAVKRAVNTRVTGAPKASQDQEEITTSARRVVKHASLKEKLAATLKPTVAKKTVAKKPATETVVLQAKRKAAPVGTGSSLKKAVRKSVQDGTLKP